MYGLQCLNWNLYFHFGTHKNTTGMVPYWYGNLFQKDQLFEQTWCIHWAHPLAMVFSLTIQVGSNPVPGYRSQKGFRNRQRTADSLQERRCHPAFLLMSCWQQFTCRPPGEVIITENNLVVELKVSVEEEGSQQWQSGSATPPSWNGKLSSLPSLRLSLPSSRLHFNVLNIPPT